MKKQTIRLSESQLQRVIMESVNAIVREATSCISPEDYDDEETFDYSRVRNGKSRKEGPKKMRRNDD